VRGYKKPPSCQSGQTVQDTAGLARHMGLSQATGATVQGRSPVEEGKIAPRTIRRVAGQVKGKNMTMASSANGLQPVTPAWKNT